MRAALAEVLSIGWRPRALPRVGALAAIFLIALAVRGLYAVDLAPLMYSRQQPGTRMAWRYDETAVSILAGEGVLWPKDPDPARTGLLARPPGYSAFLAIIYYVCGRSFFAAQAVQDVLTSLACVLLAVAAGRLAGWAVGLGGGLVAAVSPHLAFPSNLVLPDALSALPLLIALIVLTLAHPDRRGRWWWSALAGLLIGAGAWLRPNVMLLAPFLAVLLVLAARDRRRAVGHGLALTGAAALAIAPITIRNYAIFNEWVPISTNGGLTLWQGVADAGGEAKGAFRRDKLVMDEEAERYGNPRYREWWAEPDGIWRDRDRYRRAREVIREHPAAYAGVMLGRMAAMVDYASGEAPLVNAPGTEPMRVRPAFEDEGDDGGADRARPIEKRPADDRRLAVGRAAAVSRPVVRLLQHGLVLVLLPLALVGAALLLIATPRATVLLLAIPLYYLLTESMFLLEWRVVTPMHYGLFAAAAAPVAALFGVLRRARSRHAFAASSYR